jgi:hypothetical protein
MRGFLKIVILCIFIFSVCIFIAKKSIDYTFKKTSYTQVVKASSYKILQKAKEV